MLISELIEKAFSDGYEYALMEQREFNNADQKELRKRLGKVFNRDAGTKIHNINEKIFKKQEYLSKLGELKKRAEVDRKLGLSPDGGIRHWEKRLKNLNKASYKNGAIDVTRLH
jgi:hypothetical protein